MHQQQVRRKLAPLLEGARMHRNRGDLAVAERMCEEVLKVDPDWPKARDEHVWTMIARGDRAPLRKSDGRAAAVRIGADLGQAPGAARPGQPRLAARSVDLVQEAGGREPAGRPVGRGARVLPAGPRHRQEAGGRRPRQCPGAARSVGLVREAGGREPAGRPVGRGARVLPAGPRHREEAGGRRPRQCPGAARSVDLVQQAG